ncbi:ATP-binding protein [Vibrio lentus]|nr:ATP-binding protein [Vibrio lentus]
MRWSETCSATHKWAGSIIRVHANELADGNVELIIEDDGKGIPEESSNGNQKARRPRLDETTPPGTGLGLNIVNEMAQLSCLAAALGKSSMEAA